MENLYISFKNNSRLYFSICYIEIFQNCRGRHISFLMSSSKSISFLMSCSIYISDKKIYINEIRKSSIANRLYILLCPIQHQLITIGICTFHDFRLQRTRNICNRNKNNALVETWAHDNCYYHIRVYIYMNVIIETQLNLTYMQNKQPYRLVKRNVT